MCIRLAIFDMGGVVVNGVALLSPMCEKLGLSKNDFIKFTTGDVPKHNSEHSVYAEGLFAGVQMGLFSSQEFWHIFSERSGISVAENYWDTLFHPVMNPGTVSVIERLKEKGIPVVCGTNTLDVHYQRHLSEGQYRVFDRVYASHLMGIIKPFGDFWYMIRESENVRLRNIGEKELACSEIFFVDDNPDNVAGALRMGIQSVRFTDVHALERVLGLTSD